MKVGLSLHRLQNFGPDPEAYAAVARKAEALGFDSLWMGDHLVFPAVLPLTYPYSPTGRGPHQNGMPWYDPWVTLAYLACATQRVRLATNVYVLPLRHPFVTARAVATLDLLSKGRVILGIGVGWLRDEFVAAGERFEDRGRRTDEIIHILRRLWTEEPIAHEGKHYSFGPVSFQPKPVQRPVPIHYGGISPAAIRRAGLLCDGWAGVQSTLEETRRFVAEIMELRRQAGRDKLPFEVTAGAPGGASASVDDLRRLEEVGVTRTTVLPWSEERLPVTSQHAVEGMERYAERVLAKL